MSNVTTVRCAGYRERVFLKAHLVSNERGDEWPRALDLWSFNASRNVVFLGELHNERSVVPVAWEGSRSREILAEHESDDAGCEYGSLDAEDACLFVEHLADAYLYAPDNMPEESALENLHRQACDRYGYVEAKSVSDAIQRKDDRAWDPRSGHHDRRRDPD